MQISKPSFPLAIIPQITPNYGLMIRKHTTAFMNMDFTEEFLKESCTKILNDPACGKVFRIKGFQKLSDGSWISLNVTHQKTEIQPIPNGQAILIVIGEGLNQAAIERYWGKSNI